MALPIQAMARRAVVLCFLLSWLSTRAGAQSSVAPIRDSLRLIAQIAGDLPDISLRHILDGERANHTMAAFERETVVVDMLGELGMSRLTVLALLDTITSRVDRERALWLGPAPDTDNIRNDTYWPIDAVGISPRIT
jgi:hypothetical protein